MRVNAIHCGALTHIDGWRVALYVASAMKKEAALSLRIPVDLREAMEAAAAREDRTLTNMVERALREWLRDQQGAQPARP